MLSEQTQSFLISMLGVMATLFIFVIGVLALAAVVIFIIDISQTKHTLLRNYPVMGHFRYLFEHMGEFMRQYFFAMDREALPFNRAQRSWVYRASKNVNNTVGFGSTRDLRRPGTVLFVSGPFPTLGDEFDIFMNINNAENDDSVRIDIWVKLIHVLYDGAEEYFRMGMDFLNFKSDGPVIYERYFEHRLRASYERM